MSNSLNRKSPVIFETHHHVNGKRSSPYGDRLDVNSSTTDLHHDFQSNTKMSKFCHECGAKFVLAIAKYCCECGVRRLVI